MLSPWLERFMDIQYFISLTSLIKETGTLMLVGPEAVITVSPVTCI